MAARASTLAQAFSNKIVKEMYEKDILPFVTNRDYEGEINAIGSKLNMLNFDRISEKNYTGSNLTADSITENNCVLTIDQYKSFYWEEKVLDNWLSYIKNPHPTVVTQAASERMKNKDTFVLGFYGDVGAGNRVGTNETTGTVTVDVTTGVVTGSATAFTAAMVGRGFKAAGHTKWYRVATYTNSTSITIIDDLDDVAAQYTGGAIGGGATYIIEAATPLNITTSNLLASFAKLKLKLDQAPIYGYSAVPDQGRFVVVPPEFENIVVAASGVALHVDPVYAELVKKGYIGTLQGMNIIKSTRLTGDNTNGYRLIAGTKDWLTYSEKTLSARIEEDIDGNFGTRFKDLFVYGAKVNDARRHFAAEGYFTFNV